MKKAPLGAFFIVKWLSSQFVSYQIESIEPIIYSLIVYRGSREYYVFSATVVCGDSQLEISDMDVTFKKDCQSN